MHAARAQDPELLTRLGQYLFALCNDEGFVGLVLETFDRVSLVLVAHPALERAIAAGGGICERALQDRGIDRRRDDLDHVSLRQPAETTARYPHRQPANPTLPCDR